jgi:hypothetical protein
MQLQETNWPARHGSSELGGVISTQLVVEAWMQMQLQEGNNLAGTWFIPHSSGQFPLLFLGPLARACSLWTNNNCNLDRTNATPSEIHGQYHGRHYHPGESSIFYAIRRSTPGTLTGSHPCQSITVSSPRKQVPARTKREGNCHWLILGGLVGELRLNNPFIHANHVKMLEQDQVKSSLSRGNFKCRPAVPLRGQGPLQMLRGLLCQLVWTSMGPGGTV